MPRPSAKSRNVAPQQRVPLKLFRPQRVWAQSGSPEIANTLGAHSFDLVPPRLGFGRFQSPIPQFDLSAEHLEELNETPRDNSVLCHSMARPSAKSYSVAHRKWTFVKIASVPKSIALRVVLQKLARRLHSTLYCEFARSTLNLIPPRLGFRHFHSPIPQFDLSAGYLDDIAPNYPKGLSRSRNFATVLLAFDVSRNLYVYTVTLAKKYDPRSPVSAAEPERNINEAVFTSLFVLEHEYGDPYSRRRTLEPSVLPLVRQTCRDSRETRSPIDDQLFPFGMARDRCLSKTLAVRSR